MKYLIIVIVLLSSCSTKKIAYTSSFEKKYHLKDVQLKDVQFYTSGPILLTRIKDTYGMNIVKGKVITIDTIDSDKIIIPKNTPGIINHTHDGRLVLNFEADGEKMLAFGISKDDTFKIQAQSWTGNKGKLMYGGLSYETTNSEVFLKIKVKSIKQLKRTCRKLTGQRIK